MGCTESTAQDIPKNKGRPKGVPPKVIFVLGGPGAGKGT